MLTRDSLENLLLCLDEDRERAGESLGLEAVAETRHVPRPDGAVMDDVGAGKRVWILDVHVHVSTFVFPRTVALIILQNVTINA